MALSDYLYYKDDWATIYCGDCSIILPMLNKVDLVVTSPPYDNLRSYNNHSFFDFKDVSEKLFEVILPGGVIVWIVSDSTINGSETGTSFTQALYFKQVGFNIHDTMIWKKNGLPLNHNRYEQIFEYMFIFSKGRPKTFNGLRQECKCFGRSYPGGSTRQGGDKKRNHNTQNDIGSTKLIGNIWDIDTGYMRATKDKIAYDHPAIFPIKLAENHILSWSNTNDIVLDNFCGSGTVMMAAKKTNRKSIGIDIEPKYCDIAVKRLRQEVLDFRKTA